MRFAAVVSLLYIISESTGNCPPDWLSLSCECHLHYLSFEISCSINNVSELIALSDNYRQNLTALSIRLEEFTVLPSSALRYDNLSTLVIHAFGLDTVKNDAFIGLEGSLSKLVLSDSYLEEIPVSAVTGLRKLKNLDMRENQLISLNASLRNMSLNALILRHNFITEIGNDVLPESLEHLDLNDNRLIALNGALKGNLIYLDISNNGINSLDGELNQVPKLKHLLASNNLIGNIDHCFSSVGQLEELYLSYNKVSEVHNGLLGLSKLKFLGLNANGLRNIEDTAFGDLKALETLELSSNKLRSFDRHLFDCLVSLHILDVSSNHLSWLDFLVSPRALCQCSATYLDSGTGNCSFRDNPTLWFLNIRDNGIGLLCCRVRRIINFLLSKGVIIDGNPCQRNG